MNLEQRTAKDIFASDPRPPRKPIRKRLLVGLAFIGIAAIVGIVRLGSWIWGVTHVPDSPIIRAELAKIRVAGYPVTIEELKEWYVAPAEEEDPVPILRRMMGEIGPWFDDEWQGFGYWDMPEADESWGAEMLTRLRDASRENEAVLTELREHRPLRGKRYPAVSEVELWRTDFQALEYGMQAPGAVGTLLAADVFHRVDGGDGDGAVLSLVAFVDVLTLVQNQPWQFTLGTSDFELFRRTLNRALTRSRPGEPSLRSLIETLVEADDPQPYIERAVANRCLGLINFEPELPLILSAMLRQRPDFLEYMAHYRSERMWRVEGKTEDMELYLVRSRQGIEGMLQAKNGQPSVKLVDDAAEHVSQPKYHSESIIVSTGLGDELAADAGEYPQLAGQLRVAIIALAAECIERKTGRYPASLAALRESFGPLNTFDPSTQRKIAYVSDGATYRFGSVLNGIGRYREPKDLSPD